MANRGIFTLATIMMMLFFLASQFDNFFFPVHFLESVIYAVILLLLFYGLEDWAYVMGFLTPLLWILLTLMSGTLVGGFEALTQMSDPAGVQNPTGLIAVFMLITGLVLIYLSARAYHREVWGRSDAKRITLGAAGVVVVYYLVLGAVLYQMVAPEG